MSQVLIARCDEFLVAFPRPLVRQVISGPTLGAPDDRCHGWRGQLAWNGGQIPLIDLRARLDADVLAPPERAVIATFEDTTLALAVDDILGLESTDLAAAREPLPGMAPIATAGDTFLMVVDFAKLFTPDERALLATACELPAPDAARGSA